MGDIFKFNLKPLIKLLGFISPSEVKEHKEIRKADLATLAEVVNKANAIEEPSFFNGKLNRNKLLLGTTVFYEDDRVTPESIKRIA
ncbi:MAG TPA: hypothetical protein P5127_07200, partial [Oscillospiraceae bacterium]|nr:hypothetical protein [Oscillospiraceae bacterium]